MAEQPKRKPYLTDWTDAEWQRIEPLGPLGGISVDKLDLDYQIRALNAGLGNSAGAVRAKFVMVQAIPFNRPSPSFSLW